jgi:hypothetical protein
MGAEMERAKKARIMANPSMPMRLLLYRLQKPLSFLTWSEKRSLIKDPVVVLTF